MASKFTILAVSDATGKLAYELAVAASRQFENIDVNILRRPRTGNQNAIKKVVQEAKSLNAVILFTAVSQEVRRMLLIESKQESVVAMDIMGPALDMLSHYFHKLPSDEPGLQYKATHDYFNRIEAVEFAVRHDAGLDMETLHQADVVLLGISRTSKTPLSMFLASQGYRCANVPIIEGVDLPQAMEKVDRKKMVGLTISAEELINLRTIRLKKLGRSQSELYAQADYVQKELEHAQEVYKKLSGIFILDITGKAIEEISSEIIHHLNSPK